MVMSPAEVGTENDFAGEDQQQLTRETEQNFLCLPSSFVVSCISSNSQRRSVKTIIDFCSRAGRVLNVFLVLQVHVGPCLLRLSL
jgi:hypothetical protein